MSGNDDTEFKLQFDADEAKRAAAAAADVEKLADSLDHVARASKKASSNTLVGGFGGLSKGAKAAVDVVTPRPGKGIGRVFSPQQFADLKNHATALERLSKAYTASAPASKTAAKAMQMLGVSGAPLRKVTIDAAKAEIALNRLFRMKGGGLKGTAAVMGSIWQRMGAPEGSGFGSGLRQKASESVMGGLGTVAGGIGTAATLGAVAVGGGLVAGAAALATSMTTTALGAEQLKFALDRITSGKGQEWWKTSSEYAEKFGMNVNQVAASLMGMQATGLSGDTTKEMFQRFADMRSQGVNAQQIDLALLGFKQMMANGVVQMEDLKQVTENLMLSRGLVMETLAKQTGKSLAELNKMQMGGQLKSTDMMKAISEAIGIQTKSPTAGGAGAAAVNATTQGAWDRLKAVFSVQSVNALSGDALAPLRQGLVSFTSWLEGPGGKAAIGGFGDMMGKMFAYAPVVVDKVVWLFETALPKAWEVAQEAWQTFSLAFASNEVNTAVWETVSGLFRDLAGENGSGVVDALNGIANIAGYAASAIALLAGGLATVAAGVMWLTQQLSDVSGWEVFLAGISSLAGPIGFLGFLTGDLLVRNLASGISNAAGAVVDALVGVVRSAISAAAGLLGSIPLIGGWFSGLGGAASEGMAQGINTSSGSVYQSAFSMGDAATAGVVDSTQTHSPSRRMHELGMYGGEGYSYGLDAAVPWAQESGAGLGEAAVSGASRSSIDLGSSGQIRNAGAGIVSASTGQSAASAPMIHATFQITVAGGTTPEQAQQLGSAMVKGAEPELAALLRRLNYSGT